MLNDVARLPTNAAGPKGDGDDASVPGTSLGRLLVVLVPATSIMYALFNGLQQILIPARLEALDPSSKVANLALLTSASAVASMLAMPIGGAISDRTRSRFGKRTPWLLLMAALSAALIVAMGHAGTIASFGVIYVCLWFTANFYSGNISAILPDRVPVARRGAASSIIGMATPIGILLGVNIASHYPIAEACWIIGLTLLVVTAALAVVAPEASSLGVAPIPRRQFKATRAVANFFAAFKSSDFSNAFASRFMLFLAYFVVAGYMYYTLQDYIGIRKLPYDSIALAVGTLASLNVAAWLVVSLFCGYLADRLDRRKLFVGISALGVAGCMAIPILFPTWRGMLAYSILSGAFIGVYFAVDLALMSLVLPDKDNEGRDFGLLAVATGLPQIMSSAIAAAIISWAGGYPALYSFASICAVLSCVFVFRIKSVR